MTPLEGIALGTALGLCFGLGMYVGYLAFASRCPMCHQLQVFHRLCWRCREQVRDAVERKP